MKIDLLSYIQSIDIPFKAGDEEIVLQYCPYCESSLKTDFSHFYFNQNKNTFYCHKCGVKGNLYKFMIDRGDISPITKTKFSSYRKPQPNSAFTSQTEKFYSWYEKNRGISAKILMKYQVGYQLDKQNKVNIIYQYFDEKNILFNRKYRTQEKKFWTEKDGEINFYGLQFLDLKIDILFISEGEDDCHALTEMGFKNVVSIPLGALNYSPSMDEILERFQIIFLMFDNDFIGQEGAKKFAEKAGLSKCQNVILPFKDARECLLNGLSYEDLMSEIDKAEYFKHDEIIKSGELNNAFMEYIQSEKKLIGQPIRVSEFNRIVGGIRQSELTVLTGHTGKGKSTFAYNFIRWAEEIGFKSMIMSFENRLTSVITKLIEIYTIKRLRVYDAVERRWRLLQDKDWIEAEYNKLNEKEIYFLNKQNIKDGYYDLAKMKKIIEYANKFHNVDIFLIDHLHYFLKISKARNPVQEIDESVRKIKQWTEELNIHIILIVHPHMMSDDRRGNAPEIGLNSLKGASSIAQEADNFWVISRREDESGNCFARLKILKNREMGRLGEIEFKVADNFNTYISN